MNFCIILFPGKQGYKNFSAAYRPAYAAYPGGCTKVLRSGHIFPGSAAGVHCKGATPQRKCKKCNLRNNISGGTVVNSSIPAAFICLVAGGAVGAALIFFIMRVFHKRATEQARDLSELKRTTLQTALETAETENRDLREQIESLRTRCDDAGAKAALFESKFKMCEERIEEFRSEVSRLEQTVKEKESLLLNSAAQLEGLGATLENERKNSAEKLRLLNEAKDQMRTEFQNLANAILEDKSKRFTEQNRTNIDQVLIPLREQINDFRKRVDDVYSSDSKERQALSEHIKILTELNQRVSREADNLTKALKGENKTQGNWGEMVLERALELSGLKKGVEYDTQTTALDDEGRMLRPDVVVHLPENRDVVIDSKVTLVAYESAVSATSEEEQKRALDAHVESLRNHVKSLSGKSYETLSSINTLDFVLLFMPIEAAFVAAIRHDPAIFEFAYEKRVILVSPSTLLVTLRTIRNMWQGEYQNRNAQEIASRAAALYDKFVSFIETMNRVKKAIGTASSECDDAIKLLGTGKGNLVRRVEEFRALGVKPKKSLGETFPDEITAQ